MKNSKLLLTILIVTLVIVATILPTFSAVPTGRAGVNFAQVQTSSNVYVTLKVERNGEVYKEYAFEEKWSDEIGGFNVELPGVTRFMQGDSITVRVNVRPGYPLTGAGSYENWLFEYMQVGQLYYADAYVGFSDTNIGKVTDKRVNFYSHSTQTNVAELAYSCDGMHAFTLNENINNASVDSFEITGTLQQTVDTQRVYLIGFSILQNNPIRDETGVGGNLVYNEILYTPFNRLWFTVTENEEQAYNAGYNNGYNQGFANGNQQYYDEGYEDGATEASGGVIQRWGAFLLTAVNGFMSFELFPGFPLWGLLAIAIAIPLLLAFLKMFAGG